MKENRYKHVAFYENEPKYKKGDIVLVDDKALVIKSVSIEALSESSKNSRDKPIRQCCGRKGRKRRLSSNVITYSAGRGKKIAEHEVQDVGLSGINKRIKELKSEVDDLKTSREQAATALGYGDYY